MPRIDELLTLLKSSKGSDLHLASGLAPRMRERGELCGIDGWEVFEDAGEPRLRFTARGNPDYLAGANDPNDVVNLFSFEMP